jgi:hypothetical protein
MYTVIVCIIEIEMVKKKDLSQIKCDGNIVEKIVTKHQKIHFMVDVKHIKGAVSGPECNCVKLSKPNLSSCDVIPSESGFMNEVDTSEVLVSGTEKEP